jgi:prepilin-type N-terminal cleavage/methylation domain-containing protein
MKKNKGFSIIEMLVTLLVLAIFLTMVVSMGRSVTQRASFTAAFNQFVADFYFARQLASKENKYVAMVFDDLGRFYTIRVQAELDDDLTDFRSYYDFKKITPLDGIEFFSGATDFAFNSTGLVRAYPVNLNLDPISVSITFFKKHEATGKMDYKKSVLIYPTGGIKIE